ncbi:hypothetical protein BJ742DRAFT_780778 [Cladochytrium replicatum]|nr:hypothetical protein BJ742DRAFT_780778 [Cladochytrium replicatum]
MSDSHLISTVGPNAATVIAAAKILVVGAGGIGCELLKCLVLSGFKHIEVVDLDTIDVSNLNRQFLFRRQHVNKPKALVARESALRFNPSVNIVAHHASIFDPQFDIFWFKQFTIVLNALDNLAARRRVNLMCVASAVPLIESGTQGHQGQVTVHTKHNQCYDCEPAPTPKTFAVCTIRSTPSAPIHCIVWAKSYLFAQLFGADDDEELPPTKEDEANAAELENLRKEASALKNLREAITTPNYARLVFQKVFIDDIERLRSMEDMWKTRRAPVAMSSVDFQTGSQHVHDFVAGSTTGDVQRDHRVWSVLENISSFIHSIQHLAQRYSVGSMEDPGLSLSFDKDDDEVMDFVAAAANLRAHAFGIEMLSRFKSKEMAGSIIPAIATTNAVIAGMIVIQAIQYLTKGFNHTRNAFLVKNGFRLLSGPNPANCGKNPDCAVCSPSYLVLSADTSKATLNDLINSLKVNGKQQYNPTLFHDEELTVEESGRIVYDIDFDDNLEESLDKLGLGHGKFVSITGEQEDGGTRRVVVIIDGRTGGNIELKAL